jgi:hypothetical protein
MPATITAFANGTAADGTLTGWTSITNVYSDDGTPSTREGTTKNLWYGNLLSFDLSALPVTADVSAATITAEWKNSADDTSGPVLLLGHRYNSADVGSATDTTGGTAYELLNYAPAGMNGTILTATGAAGFWAILRFRRTDNTTHTASVDYVKITVVYGVNYNITTAEATQIQVVDAVTVGSRIARTPAENTQLQAMDPAAASIYTVGVEYNITASEQVQIQVMDAVNAKARTNITVSEQVQLQVIDSASAKSISPLTISEQTQLQAVDAVSVKAKTNITAAENTQIQAVDSASGKSIISITPAECIQVQAGDGSLASSLFALVISKSVQTQTIDSASATADALLPSLTPAECIQIQAGDGTLASAFFTLAFNGGDQSQFIDLVPASIYTPPPVVWDSVTGIKRLNRTRVKALTRRTNSTIITR